MVVGYHASVQAQKRTWIYAGMAHPVGVALARPTRPHRLPRGSRLLLAGDLFARGLAPPIRRLCADRKVRFKLVEASPKKVDAPFLGGELARQAERIVAEVKGFSPTVTLVSLPWPELMTSDKLDFVAAKLGREVRSTGSSVAWIRPPTGLTGGTVLKSVLDRSRVPSFHSEALQLPLGPDQRTPTVVGYAGWAGAIWRWLR